MDTADRSSVGQSVPATRTGFISPLYAFALLTSAVLLFVVQPVVAKSVLPLLGGTPAVWNTCVAFFQVALFGGYLYAHILATRLALHWQVAIHSGLLILAGLMLPIDLASSWSPWHENNPRMGLLLLLTVGVGLPFFVLAATAPLLQSWFARTADPSARDPYYLYVASNIGSMLALLSYPTAVEVLLPIQAQLGLWQAVYWPLAAILLLCGLIALRWRGESVNGAPGVVETDELPATSDQVFWVVLAFIPSSLMLGLTTHFTTDIASIPLFWIVPLALYLLTFIIAFSRVGPAALRRVLQWVPIAVAVLLVLSLSESLRIIPLPLSIVVHLGAFFVLALTCHGRLTERRPNARYLTRFYLFLSFGGMLGGLFNALLAPVIFNGILEYPLVGATAAIVLALVTVRATDMQRWGRHFLIAFAVATAAFSLFAVVREAAPIRAVLVDPLANYLWVSYAATELIILLVIGAAALLLLYRRWRHAAYAGTALALALVAYLSDFSGGKTLFKDRTFFGVIEAYDDPNGLRYFLHGTTNHGAQHRDPEHRRDPLTYFHRDGPTGDVWKALAEAGRIPKDIAVLGLGAGTLAAYGEPGQHFTFYEIDPVVAKVAQDKNLFTYLSDTGATYNIVVGDGRLKIKSAPDASYDLMVMDAFSSDAIPLHLVSREALQLYLTKLKPDGILAFNVTNRFVDLRSILGNLAADAGLSTYYRYDAGESPNRSLSEWMIMTRNDAALPDALKTGEWEPWGEDENYPIWTDAYSNLLGAVMWR